MVSGGTREGISRVQGFGAAHFMTGFIMSFDRIIITDLRKFPTSGNTVLTNRTAQPRGP